MKYPCKYKFMHKVKFRKGQVNNGERSNVDNVADIP